jgi:hypothetical protein
VDIEEFYDADDRRRQSAEIELGGDWHDAKGVRYELNWIEDTGELYVMREPAPPEWADPFGGIHVRIDDKATFDSMTVAVVAHIDGRDKVESVLGGWLEAMEQPNSAEWLAERLRDAGVAVTPSN